MLKVLQLLGNYRILILLEVFCIDDSGWVGWFRRDLLILKEECKIALRLYLTLLTLNIVYAPELKLGCSLVIFTKSKGSEI